MEWQDFGLATGFARIRIFFPACRKSRRAGTFPPSRRRRESPRPYLAESLSRFGFEVWDGAANFLLFRTRTPLYDALLARGILVRCCANFEGLDADYYRVAVRTHAENEILIREIGEILS